MTAPPGPSDDPAGPSGSSDHFGQAGRLPRAPFGWLLVAVAVVLVVIHFVLDAGDDGEAPRWIIWAAVACAFAGALAGALARRR